MKLKSHIIPTSKSLSYLIISLVLLGSSVDSAVGSAVGSIVDSGVGLAVDSAVGRFVTTGFFVDFATFFTLLTTSTQ